MGEGALIKFSEDAELGSKDIPGQRLEPKDLSRLDTEEGETGIWLQELSFARSRGK